MSIEKVLEKVDAIEAANLSKIDAVKSEVAATVDAAKAELVEKVAALEAKVASIQAPEIMRPRAKSVTADVNRMVKEQLRDFAKSGNRMEKEIKLFESVDQHDAYLKEQSALTGSGAGVGGRVAYDPTFVQLRLQNPMRGLSRTVATDGAQYTFRAKTGDAGAQWGYAIQNNGNTGGQTGSGTTQNTVIWQQNLQDINVQFPIRTAALDDIDGLEGNVVADMLAEFGQAEGYSMVQNNDQAGSGSSTPAGGADGLRGLNQYGGSNASYTAGTISASAFGSSGTTSTNGLHSLATYDQITTNAAGSANNIVFKDLINFVHLLPQQYWTPSTKWMVSPLFLAAVRGLTDLQGTPVFERMSPLVTDGIVGKLLGFDVVVNNWVSSPLGAGTPSTYNRFPAYFGDWSRGHTIVDRLSMVLRRYDQTLPGYITYFGEKRLTSSVVDPKAIIRYRSTATAASAG